MRHEFRRSFEGVRAAAIVAGRPGNDVREALPADIAFLADAHIDRHVLAKAVVRSRQDGVSAATALLAGEGVSETLYYLALARHLGVPFITSWTAVASDVDPAVAIRSRRARLAENAPAAWMLAPTDEDIALMLEARDMGLAMPDIAIAPPSTFCGLLRQQGRHRFASEASLGLPSRAPHLSAKGAADWRAALVACLCALTLCGCVLFAHRVVAVVFGAMFLAGIVFRLMICAAGLAVDDESAEPLPDVKLPSYTILVPLHDEVEMASDLVASLAALDYPRSKLEVLFLTEQDDGPTRRALQARALPFGFRVITLPDGSPRTKPRALNFGLLMARGAFVTVFDAEDRPERDQVRKAAAALLSAPPHVGCFQARLAIANGSDGLLPSLFAIEYAALFDLFNIGLSRCRLPLPLGGTSNHFRARDLRAVGAWDAWNVTEDADLGLRLARFGLETGSLDSTTWETALVGPAAWLKQRRRWSKGWIQTLLVLVRDRRAAYDLGVVRSVAVALMLWNLVIGPLLLPLVLAALVYDVGVAGWPNPHGIVEGLEATLAVSVAMFGVGATLWCGAVGLQRQGLHLSWGDLPWLLPYQLLISLAAWVGLSDLIRHPYYWHKTNHRRATDATRGDLGLPATRSERL